MGDRFKNFSIIVLLLFNLFFLYKNRELRMQFKVLSDEIPVILSSSENLKINEGAVADMGKGMKIITFIWEVSCSPCVQHEVELLNEYHAKFEENIKIVFVKNSENPQLSGANFVYNTVNKTSEVLNKNLLPQNPLSIVFDENFVYDIRKVNIEKPYSKLFSYHFYENQLQLFEEIQ